MKPRIGVCLAQALKFDVTEAQLKILQLLATEQSNLSIGKVLYLSEDTVKTHIRRMLKRSPQWVTNRTQLVVWAIGLEILVVEPLWIQDRVEQGLRINQ